ncbi:tRNA dihydrouridine synthase DusB [Desulfatibacillum aliphaticivorans]|uniref:tRNA dihydrouridine synthase DusB n=1 Tax=Desulfatibacillum aliphaticivorans TaxID=218208 RepID=UPI0004144B45|nr:tRNA dihydrouridine synthase DusB [Desulfatibacillum aliphaticivorans]
MLKIASLKLDNPLVCAPLAGVTNLPFRLMAKRHGAALVCSEMISSNGLIRYQKKTMELMASKEEERPLSIQIFGSDPGVLADSARIVAEHGADIVDINFGCSVKKVLKGGAGSALMADLPRAEKILKEVRKAISLPFTIKMRSGWDASGDEAMALGRIAQDAGVDAVALHPRTAKQGFSGHSDWSQIKRLKQELTIPVIGNGDVTKPEHVLEMMEQTGCDGVMIGRAVLYAPWIFRQALCLLENRPMEEIDLDDRKKALFDYLDDTMDYLGEEHGCRVMRSRLAWFVKGLPNAAKFRGEITRIASKEQARDLIEEFFRSIEKRREEAPAASD